MWKGERDTLCLRYEWRPARLPSQVSVWGGLQSKSCMLSAAQGVPFQALDWPDKRPVCRVSDRGVPQRFHWTGISTNLRSIPTEVLILMIALDWMSKPRICSSRSYAFFDIRVSHASSNCKMTSAACYCKHELKKKIYDKRISEVEHGSFMPIVLSSSGGWALLQQWRSSD